MGRTAHVRKSQPSRWRLVTKNGRVPIVGTLETLSGVALIENPRFTSKGAIEFDWQGETEIDWDSQTSVRRGKGLVFVCADGRQWTVDELTLIAEGGHD
ncbi:MAG: hypothetical protein ACM31O_03875 [Bacteroidota bacterium]